MSQHSLEHWRGTTLVYDVKVFAGPGQEMPPDEELKRYLPFPGNPNKQHYVTRLPLHDEKGEYLLLLLSPDWNTDLAKRMGKLRFLPREEGNYRQLDSDAELGFQSGNWQSQGRVELDFGMLQPGKLLARIDFEKVGSDGKGTGETASAFWCW